jgi:NAD(P)-dependent dehydrogenase (short-subunit alcohol dehydrogenase family)
MIVPEADKSDELRRFRLDGRVVLVTGGYGGIGSRLCEALAGVGARVVVIGRDAARAHTAAEQLTQAGGEALAAVADVTKREEVDAAVDAAMERFGRVDGLVTTVGGGAGEALYPAESYPEDAWDWIMDLNLSFPRSSNRLSISSRRSLHLFCSR